MIGNTVASAGIAGFITASVIASSHFVAQHHFSDRSYCRIRPIVHAMSGRSGTPRFFFDFIPLSELR
jgi:hypothetical protein